MPTTTEKLKAVVETETKRAQASLKAMDESLDKVARDRKAKVDVDIDPDMAGFNAELTAGLKAREAVTSFEVKTHLDRSQIDMLNNSLNAMRPSFAALSTEATRFGRTATRALGETDDAMRRNHRTSEKSISIWRRMANRVGVVNVNLRFLRKILAGLGFLAIISAVQALTNVLVGLGAAVVALIGSLSRLTAVLATIPSFMASIGQAAGGLISIFSGIGGALSGFAADQKAIGGGGGGIAQSIEDTNRKIADYARSLEDSNERIFQAERRVERLGRALADAQNQESEAQERLNQAREEALDYLNDLRRGNQDLANEEEEATLRLEEARRILLSAQRDQGIPDADLRQAKLDVAKAEVELAEVQDQRIDQQRALSEAEKKGIAQSDALVGAEKDLADAKQNIIDITHDQMLADRELTRAREDNLRLIADEAKLTQAAAGGGGGGVSAFAQAMKDLGPNAQAFVREALKIREQFIGIKKDVQEIGIVGFTELMISIQGLMPQVGDALRKTGAIFSNFASGIAEFFATDSFKLDFGTLLGVNNTILTDILSGFSSLIMMFTDLAVAAAPFTTWLSGITADGLDYLAGVVKINRENGDLGRFFERAKDTMITFGRILSNLGTVFLNIFGGATIMGDDLLKTFERVTGEWAEWTSSAQGQNAIKSFFEELIPVVKATTGFFAGLVSAFVNLGSGDSSSNFLMRLKDDVLPSLITLFRNAGESGTLDALVSALVSFIDVLAVLSAHSGVLRVFAEGMSMFFDAIAKFLSIPGVGRTLGLMATGFAAIKIALLGWKLSGLAKVVSFIKFLKAGALASAFTKAGAAISTFTTFLLANPVILFIVAIVALIAAIYLLWKNWDKVSGWIATALDWLKKQWDKLWEAIKANFPRFIVWLKTVPGMIRNALGAVGGWLADVAPEVWDGFLAAMKVAAKVVWGWLKTLGSLILENLDDVGLWLLDVGIMAVEGLWEGWKFMAKLFFEGVKEVPDLIKDNIGDVGKLLWDAGKSVMSGLWEGLKWYWTNNVRGWLFLKDKVLDAVGSGYDWLVDTGQSVIKGFWDGLQWFWRNRVALASWLGDRVKSALTNAGSWLVQSGKDAIWGFWEGFKGLWYGSNGIRAKIIGLFKALPGWIMDALKISSPSRVMMDIGEDTAKGFEVGMMKGMDRVAALTPQFKREIVMAGQSPSPVQHVDRTTNDDHSVMMGGITINGYNKSPGEIVREAYLQSSRMRRS